MPRGGDGAYGSKELFRYVRLKKPLILELGRRVAELPDLRDVLAVPRRDQERWARGFVKSDAVVTTLEDLEYDYLASLEIDGLPPDRLPSRDVIGDLGAFHKARPRQDPKYRSDHDRALRSLVAFRILRDDDKARDLARLVDFIEVFPRLDRVTEPRRYATAVLRGGGRRGAAEKPARAARRARTRGAVSLRAGTGAKEELRELSRLLGVLWRTRAHELREQRRRITDAYDELSRRRPGAPPRAGKPGSAARRRALATYAKKYREMTEQKRAELAALKRDYKARVTTPGLLLTLGEHDNAFYKNKTGQTKAQLTAMQDQMTKLLADLGLSAQGFCQAYEQVVTLDNASQDPVELDEDTECFRESPEITFDEGVEVLGTADLVRVEESFVGYTVGEISYVENVLPGELRRRKIKDTRSFERLEEVTVEEGSDVTSETAARAGQELTSEVESELNTRFNTDVSASMNASGGGTLGVIDLEGGAALSAGLGIGVDTSLSSATKSELSQEIISRAVERTRRETVTRRMSRSYSLHESTNLHEIRNTDGEPQTGIYCFLDKKVCISETVYGRRVFLLANVRRPGRNLFCAREVARRVDLQTRGELPEFDITPDDIHPSTYKELVGRFHAADVQPPPPPSMTLARTYKTDATNATMENTEFKGRQIADLLVPYFERYKRYLITDNIRLPDGYQVQDVWVTVNHGSNGVSIPAHLPLSVTAAALCATPSLLSAGLTFWLLPYAWWQISYLASPLLHLNADSSNITATIGNESQDSPYYFFQPDILIQQIFDLLGSLSAIGPELLETVQSMASALYTGLSSNATDIPSEVGELVESTVSEVIEKVKDVFEAVISALNPADGVDLAAEIQRIWDAMAALATVVDSSSLGNLQGVMGTLFDPLEEFVDGVIGLLQDSVSSVLTDLFSWLDSMFDNSDVLVFPGAHGLKHELPVSFNTVAIKPGVTINLSACLRRTDEALDRWRLATFNSLHQAYLQQVADYESRAFLSGDAHRMVKSPGTLRREEHLALKEIVLHALNNHRDDRGNAYELARMNLFENAIDWKNLSFKLYNYGPAFEEVVHEKDGLYAGSDVRRRAFLTAAWAQVLVPLQPVEHLEARLLEYFASGETDLAGELSDEELAALYQDLVLNREMDQEGGEPPSSRPETLPTDLIVLRTSDLDDLLPANPDTPCGG